MTFKQAPGTNKVIDVTFVHCTKMKFFIKDFFSKCDQIRRFLRIWSHLLKKSLMENFIFCAVSRIWGQQKLLVCLSQVQFSKFITFALSFEIYEAKGWTTNNTTHILSNISRSKGNKTVKFGQLIEHNIGNIFLEKAKCGGETSPRVFYQIIKIEHISESTV